MPGTVHLALVAAACVLTVGTNAKALHRPLSDTVMRFEPLTIAPHHTLTRRSYASITREHKEDERPIAPFKIPITAFNKTMNLHLKPATHLFVSTGATVVRRDAKGVREETPITGHGYYSGTVDGQPYTFAHVAVHKDGSMQGIIVDAEGEGFHIDPVGKHFDEQQQGFDHVIYRESDIHLKAGPKGERPQLDQTMMGPPRGSTGTEHPPPPAPAAEGRSRRGKDEVVSQQTHVPGNNICHVALWGDKEFTKQEGGADAAILKMLQRFAVANAVFTTDSRWQVDNNPVDVQMQIATLVVDDTTSLSPGDDAVDFLTTFSTCETKECLATDTTLERDFKTYCLAAGFTHREFSGTLGLAWTAYPPSTHNVNGGICQAWYTNAEGYQFTINSNIHTSLNFGQKQPELQLSLVLAHEFGHNFGAPHDGTDASNAFSASSNPSGDYFGDETNGNFLMYPYSVNGAKANNEMFSTQSIKSMNAVIAESSGCFLAASKVCGNFVVDDGEECDCGGSDAACSATGDSCCTSACTFQAGAVCSPLDAVHGACCSEGCGVQEGVECRSQSVCTTKAECGVDGKCPDADAMRPENAICDQSIEVCTSGSCSHMCDATGGCTKSICALWGKEECTDAVGAGACAVTCKAVGAADESDCKGTSDLGDPLFDAYNAEDAVAAADDYLVSFKAPSSTCFYLKGEASSGLCDPDGLCVPADTEEDLLAQMYAAYDWAITTFTAWFGRADCAVSMPACSMPNGFFLLFGFIVGMLLCCGMCYVGNHPTWSHQLADCCGCDDLHDHHGNKVHPGTKPLQRKKKGQPRGATQSSQV